MNNLINLEHNITYNDINLFNRYPVFIPEEQEQFRNIIYKYDLLSIFSLTDFLEDIIDNKISELYTLMIKNKEIENLSYKLSKKYNEFDKMYDCSKENGFIILFSYDYLHLFYPCIVDFIKNNSIDKNNISLLENYIINN
jgi:hypothetical protein